MRSLKSSTVFHPVVEGLRMLPLPEFWAPFAYLLRSLDLFPRASTRQDLRKSVQWVWSDHGWLGLD